MLHLGGKFKNEEYRKYYSGYAGKIGQVSLTVGNPYLGIKQKGVTAHFC
jgi:hypothetical protein